MDNTTKDIIDLDGGTHQIIATNGMITAVGFSSPAIYIDGRVSSTVNTNWHHIAITTNTAIDVNKMDIGRVGADYFDGQIDDVRLYNYVLTAQQIKEIFNGGAVRFE